MEFLLKPPLKTNQPKKPHKQFFIKIIDEKWMVMIKSFLGMTNYMIYELHHCK
jgi:hypothetical protein